MTFKPTKYSLMNCADGRIFEDSGWTLADPQGETPSLVRAVYEKKEFGLRDDLDGFYKFADWLPIKRTLSNSSAPVTYKSKALADYLKLDNLYIDIGAKDRADAEAQVRIGDTAVYDTSSFVNGRRLFSPYLDDRIACVVLLLAMERLGETDNDLYFVFTAQEEVGIRGAKTAAYGIDPDYGVAVDVTDSDDVPEPDHLCSARAGKGAAIKVMDRSVICHPAVVKKLEALAAEKGIPTQREVLKAGGTDAGAIHQSRAGVYTGGISIPTRYIHTPLEMADLDDVEACAALAAAFAEAKLD